MIHKRESSIYKRKSSIVKLCLAVAFAMTIMGGTYYYVRYANVAVQGPISEYQASRDKAEILAFFKTELYWLSANPDYDAEYMLDHRAPNKENQRYYGEMQIKVLRENDQFIGFVAYYKRTFDEGFLNFVCIKPHMRGKRYAEQLMRYAEDDLRAMGVHRIRLLTRTINHRARALYMRMGYTVVELDEAGGFVYFLKLV